MPLIEEELPAVADLGSTLSTVDTKYLDDAAVIAGAYGWDGPELPTPTELRWAMRLLRKAAWHQLRKRRRRHYPWDLWDSYHHRT